MHSSEVPSPVAFLVLPSKPESVGKAREFVTQYLNAWGVETFGPVLAASELVTNAVQHAPGLLAVGVSRTCDDVSVHVVDGHPHCTLSLHPSAPTRNGQGGWGLFLTRKLADDLTSTRAPELGTKTMTATFTHGGRP